MRIDDLIFNYRKAPKNNILNNSMFFTFSWKFYAELKSEKRF